MSDNVEVKSAGEISSKDTLQVKIPSKLGAKTSPTLITAQASSISVKKAQSIRENNP
jgi:ribosomal protein L10